jgi:hypothetical protein
MDRGYIELSGRIASCARFCEFLASGGRVLDRGHDAGWRDVTAEVLERERRKVDELEQVCRLLYPELASYDVNARSLAH